MGSLIKPHGGKLRRLLASSTELEVLREEIHDLPSINLTPRQLCDLELLLNGAFSPLVGFMTRETYESVLDNVSLPDGTIWPLPITLDVPGKIASSLKKGDRLVLRDQEGFALAVLTIDDIWEPDVKAEARKIYQTDEPEHPGVAYLFENMNPYYVGGKVKGLSLPHHYDYKLYRRTPGEVRQFFKKMGWRKVVAFQTRRPLHNAHKEMTLRAANRVGANILLHPIVGQTSPGDIDYYARIRCYEAIVNTYPPETVLLNLLPFAMRMAGPREALLHAIINKNYGCSYIIITPNHADPFTATSRPAYYPRYSAIEYVRQFEEKCGIRAIAFERMVYVEEKGQYVPEDECSENDTPKMLSATELRRRLELGLEIPNWYSPPEVVTELRRAYPPRNKQGFTLFFTGLAGSGKSTLAKILYTKFLQMGDRPVTLLDGDIVRKHLSSELGYSAEHRHINVIRIGFVASEITKNRGIAICAPIAPYEKSRRYNRDLISRYGGYIEIYVATPLEVCMKRDPKGLYSKALSGKIKGVTGVDDPYEPPESPEIVIDTTNMSPEEGAQEILAYLKKHGYLGGSGYAVF